MPGAAAGTTPEAVDAMIEVIFITAQGARRAVRGRIGASLMHAAVNGDVPGIDAICGGDCACATCQVLVEAGWQDRIEPPSLRERTALRYVHAASPSSRLSCAVRLTAALDGLVVRVPARQY